MARKRKLHECHTLNCGPGVCSGRLVRHSILPKIKRMDVNKIPPVVLSFDWKFGIGIRNHLFLLCEDVEITPNISHANIALPNGIG